MATYAVGDIQGCYKPLITLLEKVKFDPSKDTLLCVGDLVNRGPNSLQVLRYLKSLGDSCKVVLGNHDLHLLSMYYGIRKPRELDSMIDVLQAPDANELCHWLRQQPLMYVDEKRKVVLCHAGIYPWWTLDQAKDYAAQISETLKNEKKCIKLLSKMYGSRPAKWHDKKSRMQQQRFIVNAFTRMRFCSPLGYLQFTQNGYKKEIRKNRIPWFKVYNKDNRQSLAGYRIIFGHWSAVGLRIKKRYLALDTGYVWGRSLTLAKIPKKPNKKIKIYQTYD